MSSASAQSQARGVWPAAAGESWPVRTAARCSGWSGTPSYSAVQHLVGGLDAQRRNRRGAQRLARQEHQTGLEQCQVAEAAGVVALGHLDQAGQDRGAQEAVLFADRVGQLERFRAFRCRGHAEGVVGGLGDERVGQHLGEAGVGQRLDERGGAAAGTRVRPRPGGATGRVAGILS